MIGISVEERSSQLNSSMKGILLFFFIDMFALVAARPIFSNVAQLMLKSVIPISKSFSNESLTIKEDIAYQGFRNIVKRSIKLPNNKIIEIEVLKSRHESVVVFNWDSKTKTTTLVREYHPGPEQTMFGTVAGMYEKWKHTSALECAQHELEEEANLQTSKWYPLLGDSKQNFEKISMPFDKYSNNRFYPFLALDCEKVSNPKPLDEEEYITIHENISYHDIMDLIRTGRMNVVSTYTCLLAFQKLDELGIEYK